MFSTTLSTIKRFFILIAAIILLNNCSKEKTDCWDVYTSNGSLTKTVCGQTEEEIQAVYGKYYDRASSPKYCWKADYPGYFYFVQNLSEKMAAMFYQDAQNIQKVSCGYCQKWECHNKNYYKPTGEYTNTLGYLQYPCGDTCSTLYPGRQIVIRETADSIIYVIWYKKL